MSHDKQSRLIIVHDVLGTLFSLESPTRALLQHYPELDPKFAELIIYDWYHAAQRDYTNLSINSDYRPISQVFSETLPRILSQAGLQPQQGSDSNPDPNSNANPNPDPDSSSTKEQDSVKISSSLNLYPKVTQEILKSLSNLTPRPGMVQAFNQIYRNRDLLPDHIQKVDLWGATNGGTELARKLFQKALGEDNGKDLDLDLDLHLPTTTTKTQEVGIGVGIFSCDEIKTAKPCPQVYEAVKQKIGFGKDGNQRAWFVATHSWDTYAAKKSGFKTAWVSNEEHFNCSGIYGLADVMGKDLEEVSMKILAFERSN